MSGQTVDFDVVRAVGAALPEVRDASGPRGTALKIKGRLARITRSSLEQLLSESRQFVREQPA